MSGMTGVNGIPLGARVLIAGVGNVLRRDDGFGIAVVQALELDPASLPPGARVVEVGIGGIALVHELMEGYGSLILVDAVERGGDPGTLYVLEPEVPSVAAMPLAERRMAAADLHQLVPARSLVTAAALDVLPPSVRIVGCQPGETEELSTELSPPVAAAVARAVEVVRGLAGELTGWVRA